jgi:hypothetical protein
MRIVLLKDLFAAHLGLDPEMGLLYPSGATLDACLPHVEEKLLREGFAITEEEWKLRQQQAEAGKAKHPHENKRGRGSHTNKAK